MKNILRVANVFMVLGGMMALSTACNNIKPTQNKKDVSCNVANNYKLPIAYIDTDSLLRSYDFAVYLQEELLKKEEKSRTDFNEQAKKVQGRMNEFQRKLQNNGFLSRDRANKEQQAILKREQELKALNAKLSNDLMKEQEKVNHQLRDTLISYIKEYNADDKYQLILSNTMGDNVLYGAKGANITKTVTSALNARYAKSKKK